MRAALVLVICLFVGCSAQPTFRDYLQTQEQINALVPVRLTDLGILHYGEAVLSAWGLRSHKTEALNIAGQITLAGLSTGALVAGGSGASRDVITGMAGGFNFLLQSMNIIKPAERNDARHEGAAIILDARGNFILALAEKGRTQISNTEFTPQGALYFKQINAAQKIVDRLIVGLAPRIEDQQAVLPVPVKQQVSPPPEWVTPPEIWRHSEPHVKPLPGRATIP